MKDAYPTTNPHPERGPLWVRDDGVPSLRRMMLMVDDRPFGQINTLLVDEIAAQIGQDLPEGFALAPVATGAALIAVDPDGKEWERSRTASAWFSDHRDCDAGAIYLVRRVAKPAKVKVKVGDAYGRTIDGKPITHSAQNVHRPFGGVWCGGPWIDADADGMVEVDPLDGDR